MRPEISACWWTVIRGYVLSTFVGAIVSALIAVMNSVSTMAVCDFILHFWPQTSERVQIRLGRLAIVICAALGAGAAYVVYKQPEGIYKSPQTISIYLVMPIAPAIIFGILSKRVTFVGAAVSVLVGIVMATVFVVDALMPLTTAAYYFPWLHHPLTFNYTYRGGWGTLIIVAVLFFASALTTKTDPAKWEKTTIEWRQPWEPFRGLADWRLHWAVLAVITVFVYWWLW